MRNLTYTVQHLGVIVSAESLGNKDIKIGDLTEPE